MKKPQDRMRGVAQTIDGCAIEFGDEPQFYFKKIVYEHLPPARLCGMWLEPPVQICR